MRNHPHLLGWLVVLLFAGGLFAFDQDPVDSWHKRIPYSGHLERDGAPLNEVVSVEFQLWTTPSGGASPAFSEVLDVDVQQGAFSVLLGDTPGNAVDDELFATRDTLYLQVLVDGAAVGARQRILASPFASGTAGVPPGVIMAWGGQSADIPAGWMLCDGTAVSRSLYPALFAAIGTAHGAGNGSTTFHLPDHRGRFLRGVSGGTSRDPDRNARSAANSGGFTGNAVGTVQGAATARPSAAFTTTTTGNHNHTNGNFDRLMIIGSNSNSCGRSFSSGDVSCGEPDLARSASIQTNGNHNHSVNGGGDNETRPQNASVHYIIKY